MDGLLLGCSGSTQGVTVAGLETVSLPVVARILTFAIKKPSFAVTQSPSSTVDKPGWTLGSVRET